MRAYDLILKLQELVIKHGNKQVNIHADIIASILNINATTEITEVQFDKDDNDIFLRADYHKNN